mmetsp:Transcript_22708/g.65460  ORF Transcript_22708/g.65460 Transcript_22708/m.65460 type:complete len:262 (-) Transcript_22708:382-1167(-)
MAAWKKQQWPAAFVMLIWSASCARSASRVCSGVISASGYRLCTTDGTGAAGPSAAGGATASAAAASAAARPLLPAQTEQPDGGPATPIRCDSEVDTTQTSACGAAADPPSRSSSQSCWCTSWIRGLCCGAARQHHSTSGLHRSAEGSGDQSSGGRSGCMSKPRISSRGRLPCGTWLVSTKKAMRPKEKTSASALGSARWTTSGATQCRVPPRRRACFVSSRERPKSRSFAWCWRSEPLRCSTKMLLGLRSPCTTEGFRVCR